MTLPLMRPPALVLLLTLAALVACGASTRQKVLRGNLASLNVARDTTLVVSKTREEQIVTSAVTKDAGRDELAAWRARVDTVVAAIEIGYRAIYAAAILDDAKSSSDATTATLKALTLFKELQQ